MGQPPLLLTCILAVWLCTRATCVGAANAAEWLANHYSQYPVGAGLKVTEVVEQENGSVVVNLMIVDADRAASVRGSPIEHQLALIRWGCPAPDAKIWRVLGSDGQLIIKLLDRQGDINRLVCPPD
jgi:hypothetical protein